jgi:hypothetical protein
MLDAPDADEVAGTRAARRPAARTATSAHADETLARDEARAR